MITPWQLYWLTRLDSIGAIVSVIFVGLVVILIVGSLALLFGSADGVGEAIKFGKNCWKRFFWPTLFVALIGGAIPSTKEMAAILLLPKIANATAENEEIKKLPNNIATLANEWLEELKPKKEGK